MGHYIATPKAHALFLPEAMVDPVPGEGLHLKLGPKPVHKEIMKHKEALDHAQKVQISQEDEATINATIAAEKSITQQQETSKQFEAGLRHNRLHLNRPNENDYVGDDDCLAVGSLIQIPSNEAQNPLRYGTIKWIGLVPTVKGTIAGIELVRLHSDTISGIDACA